MSKEVELRIAGMTCSHCEMSVTKELAKLAGAKDIVVTATAGTAHLSVDDQVTTEQILEAVEEAGYKLTSS